jgi:hypothetical protein
MHVDVLNANAASFFTSLLRDLFAPQSINFLTPLWFVSLRFSWILSLSLLSLSFSVSSDGRGEKGEGGKGVVKDSFKFSCQQGRLGGGDRSTINFSHVPGEVACVISNAVYIQHYPSVASSYFTDAI